MEEQQKSEKPKYEGPKLSVEERKQKATELIATYREQKIDDKEIVKRVATEIGVSNTYVYKMVKAK